LPSRSSQIQPAFAKGLRRGILLASREGWWWKQSAANLSQPDMPVNLGPLGLQTRRRADFIRYSRGLRRTRHLAGRKFAGLNRVRTGLKQARNISKTGRVLIEKMGAQDALPGRVLTKRWVQKQVPKQQSPTLENSQAPTTPARKVRDRRKMRQAKLAKAISKQDGVIDRSGHQALSSKNQFEASLRQELGLP
jgi:hypothetical protein